jgi:DNA polymerase-3 subunit epsilon
VEKLFFIFTAESMYAIVDIETTGGHASSHGITEIAIILHNGMVEEGRYNTLVNPGMPVPRHITALTGISNAMLADAPRFSEVAGNIARLLEGRIFIAHNVNFDYSFIRHHLAGAGIDFQARKLCTVRMARKIFPGLPRYSLGNLCRTFQISIRDRHRAMGDAEATATLFTHLLANDQRNEISAMLKAGSRESYLPMHLDASAIDQLPYTAGVYFFHDARDRVVYVGKAVNLRKRVTSHFSNNAPSRRKQELIRQVHRISFTECGSSFAASLLESLEIRSRWPAFNLSQKQYEPRYGLFLYEDQRGLLRLAIEKKRKGQQPLYAFSLLSEGYAMLRTMTAKHRLCTRLNFPQQVRGACGTACQGACEGREPVAKYNQRLRNAVQELQETLPSFAVVEKGMHTGEQCVALMDRGVFYGFGYLHRDTPLPGREALKSLLTPCADNSFLRSLLLREASLYPHKVHMVAE